MKLLREMIHPELDSREGRVLRRAAAELADTRMEHYEVANGMRPVWVDVEEALRHNQAVMARQEKTMGQSIQRETFMLELIAREQLPDLESTPA